MKCFPLGLRALLVVLSLMWILPHATFAQAGSRSIRSWVHCDGKTDDETGVTAAFAAAKDGAFTLVVDCPVFIHVGYDIRRPIYIDNGTTVQFTANGLFKVDNIQMPSFVLANSTKVRLLGWRIQFVGQLPVEKHLKGYYDNGKLVQPNKVYDPSSAYSDIALTQWLTAHRGIHYVNTRAPWPGGTNGSAIFLIAGSTKDVQFRDFKMFVAPEAKGSQFIPMAFASMISANSDATVTGQLPTDETAAQFSVPSNITFSNIDLDGYYMGWQGSYQDTLFEHIRAHRYGDLQDDQGGTVGGIEKWFAPPHLFYLNYGPRFPNRNIRIVDVIDYGVRVGVARDKGGSDSGSGYANSLKIGGVNCVVDGYKSYRPDGFMDVLTSNGLKISNVDATYDSAFLNGIYPAIRFPQAPYQNVTFENITLTDKASVPRQVPIGGTYSSQNSGIVMTNVRIVLNGPVISMANPSPSASPKLNLKAAAAAAPAAKPVNLCPRIVGGNNVEIQYTVAGHVQQCH